MNGYHLTKLSPIQTHAFGGPRHWVIWSIYRLTRMTGDRKEARRKREPLSHQLTSRDDDIQMYTETF